MAEKVNLAAKLATFGEPFSPKIVAELNDCEIEVVKAKGEFGWHTHPDTDDFFLVLAGRLTIQLRDRDVDLGPGELFVVPRGVEHCPKADEEAHVLLIEPGRDAEHRRCGRRPHRGRGTHLSTMGAALPRARRRGHSPGPPSRRRDHAGSAGDRNRAAGQRRDHARDDEGDVVGRSVTLFTAAFDPTRGIPATSRRSPSRGR